MELDKLAAMVASAMKTAWEDSPPPDTYDVEGVIVAVMTVDPHGATMDPVPAFWVTAALFRPEGVMGLTASRLRTMASQAIVMPEGGVETETEVSH